MPGGSGKQEDLNLNRAFHRQPSYTSSLRRTCGHKVVPERVPFVVPEQRPSSTEGLPVQRPGICVHASRRTTQRIRPPHWVATPGDPELRLKAPSLPLGNSSFNGRRRDRLLRLYTPVPERVPEHVPEQ